MSQITEDTTLVATAHSVSTTLEGEAVILDTDAGEYYGLNEVGARIWVLLQDPMTFEELVEALLEEYAIDRDRCKAEVRGLLEQMTEKGLLKVQSVGANRDNGQVSQEQNV